MNVRELITNPVRRRRAVLTRCRLGSLLGALALVPLLLCTASGNPLIDTSGGEVTPTTLICTTLGRTASIMTV